MDRTRITQLIALAALVVAIVGNAVTYTAKSQAIKHNCEQTNILKKGERADALKDYADRFKIARLLGLNYTPEIERTTDGELEKEFKKSRDEQLHRYRDSNC